MWQVTGAVSHAVPAFFLASHCFKHEGSRLAGSRHFPTPKCGCTQVIDETHQAYVRLKSGKRANSEELSLI